MDDEALGGAPSWRVVPLVGLTCVLVAGLYSALLMWPATQWFIANASADFGNTLPAATRFVVDAHWVLLALVAVVSGSAALLSHRRLGVAACAAALLMNAWLTGFWFYAMQLPFFALAHSTG